MIRKLFLSALVAITAVSGLSITPLAADANPPMHRHDSFDRRDRRGHMHFEVLYRHRNHWDSYGTYHDRDDAERAAHRLRRQGFEVRIERDFVR